MKTCRLFASVVCLGVGLSLCADPAYGQRGGDDRGRRGDRDRGEDRRGDEDRDDVRRDRGRRGGDDRRRMSDDERRQWFISQLDRNGDGRIERSEVDSDRMWGYFERSAREAGLDPDSGVTVDKYLSARKVQQRREQRAENPTAFLPPIEVEPAPGFDTPLSEPELVLLNPDKPRAVNPVVGATGSSSSNSNRSESERSDGESSGDRTERYANSLMDRYDKNGNRILEQEEWKEMRGDPERSDLNKDGRITKDELIQRFSSFRRDDDDQGDRQRGGDSGSASRDSRGDRRARSGDDRESGDKRATYRFTSALERLPDDARRWVERYDKNFDGQVAMAEFSSSWTDSKVQEFVKLDLDGDGMVTGGEYLASQKR